MKKGTKIIIIGFGSIGQRHATNLYNLGYTNINFFDVSKKLYYKDFLPQVFKTQEFRIDKLDLNTLKQFDVAFICSPNHLHIKHALQCAQANCHLFIEKPLSHNLKDITKLQKICQQKKLINMIGCNMRFYPCLKFIKSYLTKKKLGKVYAINHECGYYLPNWRPGTDYRKNFAAHKSMGGGIILDDIHEFDLLFWLNDFAPVKDSKFIYDRLGSLKIDTEDFSIASFKFANKVLGSVQSDYLQQSRTRTCKVIGQLGNLEWDIRRDIVWRHQDKHSQKLYQMKKYDINQMYIDEVKYFFNCISKKEQTFNNLKIATQVLEYCVKK